MKIKISEIEETSADEFEALIEVNTWHCPLKVTGEITNSGMCEKIIELWTVLNEAGYAKQIPTCNIDISSLNDAIIDWKDNEGIE